MIAVTDPPKEAPLAGWHRFALGLALLACAGFALRGWSRSTSEGGSDFGVYVDAGASVLERRDPFADERFLYPPSAAVLFAPLALLPVPLAAALWQAASLAALAVCARRSAELAAGAGRAVAPILRWLPLALCLRLADSNLANAQVNAFTLFALLIAFQALDRGRERAAGLWVAVGAALKLLPAFVLLDFALRRRWRALAAGIVGCLVLGVALPLLVLGREPFAHFWSTVAAPYFHGGAVLLERREYLSGQSLVAVGHRLLSRGTDVGSGRALLALDPDVVSWILRGVALAHVALFAAAFGAPRSSRAFAKELALAVCTPLVVAPLVHKAHMLWILPGYAALLAGPEPGASRGWRVARWMLLAFSVLFVAGTAPALPTGRFARGLLSHNALFFGVELAWIALCGDLLGAARRRQHPTTEPIALNGRGASSCAATTE